MPSKLLPHSFFDRPVLEVCKDLLGKFLVISTTQPPSNGGNIPSPRRGGLGRGRAFMITEIEAYDGQEDEACHARFGKTERNAPMFGKAWCRYVYLCYGMYRMLNIVTGPGKHPSAVLIRAVESPKSKVHKVSSNDLKTLRPSTWWLILNGPGKITKHLHIDKRFNRQIASKKTWLRIEDRWVMIKKYAQLPRVWIEYAGKWAKKKWRFLIN